MNDIADDLKREMKSDFSKGVFVVSNYLERILPILHKYPKFVEIETDKTLKENYRDCYNWLRQVGYCSKSKCTCYNITPKIVDNKVVVKNVIY